MRGSIGFALLKDRLPNILSTHLEAMRKVLDEAAPRILAAV
jgi:hypothetical protein